MGDQEERVLQLFRLADHSGTGTTNRAALTNAFQILGANSRILAILENFMDNHAEPPGSGSVTCEPIVRYLFQCSRKHGGQGASGIPQSDTTSSNSTTAAAAAAAADDDTDTTKWQMATWLESCGFAEILAEALLTHPKPVGPPGDGVVAELALAQHMALKGSEDLIRSLLSDHGVLDKLAKKLWESLVALSTQSATNQSPQSKFASEGIVELSYGDISTFFGGLEGLVGPPKLDVFQGMQDEHIDSLDSRSEFTTNNYGITTTSEIEWHFVVDPETAMETLNLSKRPDESQAKLNSSRFRKADPLSTFRLVVDTLNDQLKKAAANYNAGGSGWAALHRTTLHEVQQCAPRLELQKRVSQELDGEALLPDKVI
jgi:hypothetical protein